MVKADRSKEHQTGHDYCSADVEKYPNAYQSERAQRFGEGNILEMNNVLLLDW